MSKHDNHKEIEHELVSEDLEGTCVFLYELSANTDTFVCVYDFDESRIVYAFENSARILGVERSELLGKSLGRCSDIINIKNIGIDLCSSTTYYEHLNTVRNIDFHDGKRQRLFKIKIHAFQSKEKKYYLITLDDISEQIEFAEKLERIKEIASRDSLTQLLNRTTFESKVCEYIQRCECANTTLYSAMFLVDVDNFKETNDKYGHQYGDKILRNISKDLKNTFRKSDLIGRLGGDEFVVFMKNVDDRKIIEERANILNQKLTYTFSDLTTTCSIGVVISDSSDITHEKLYREADKLMYKVKGNGKNNFEIRDINMTI